MKRDRAQQDESGQPEVPAWIVSFTDMTTLLLAFFVMLMALAKEQNPELFYQGQGAFRRNIAGLGIPSWLFGKEQKLKSVSLKRRHPTEENKEINRLRVLDPEDEEIRRIFHDLKQLIETHTSDTVVESRSIITPIRFEPYQTSLSASAERYVKEFAVDLRQNVGWEGMRIYVIGSATDIQEDVEQWLLSARRAEAVADSLRRNLSIEAHEPAWQVFAWGVGSGGYEGALWDETAPREFIRIVITGAK